MFAHPDSILYVDGAIKRAADIEVGDKIVGLDARSSVTVIRTDVRDDRPLVTLHTKHRHITAPANTRLMMLRRDPVAAADYPPRSGWWVEPRPISDLQKKCRAGATCSITDCWCLKHKRHVVTLNRLAERVSVGRTCAVGGERRAIASHFDEHEHATAARYHHIARGHIVTPVHTDGRGHRIHIAATNFRSRQIHEWGIAPALPGPDFSVERVTEITASEGPVVNIVVGEPIIVEALVVYP